MVHKKMVERSSCLKNTKNKPTLHKKYQVEVLNDCLVTKNNVKFADSLGKELVYVKTITPSSSCEDIDQAGGGGARQKFEKLDLNNNIIWKHNRNGKIWRGNYLKCCFQQPGAATGFQEIAKTQMVVLEHAFIETKSRMVLIGLVRVRNITYHKEVSIRYTLDRWTTSLDLQAKYICQSHCGTTDKFMFRLAVPGNFEIGSTVIFAVRYLVGDHVYWDNNQGNNFVVKCCE